MVFDSCIQIAYLDAVVASKTKRPAFKATSWFLMYVVSRSREAGMTFKISFYWRNSQRQLHASTDSNDPA